ncbi:MAG: sulfur carrier protein ThiS, partial [Chloroflexi bacterium]|nr:sulfur carrier protein ThiS [Chloroflexota bacterium]
MRLILNQQPCELELERADVPALLASRGIGENMVAVAVNGEVVPRNQWPVTTLTEGDTVDLVKVVAGGSETDDKPLIIGGRTFHSRLFVGTGKYPSAEAMVSSLEASGTEMVTVAIRYMDLDGSGNGLDIMRHLDLSRYQLLPNTAGAQTAKQAVTMARLAREATGTNFIKLEVIGDMTTLWPDVAGTVEATKTLKDDGFVVLAYTAPDIVTALRLEDAGADAVMPLASMIGSGRGLQDASSVQWIVERIS